MEQPVTQLYLYNIPQISRYSSFLRKNKPVYLVTERYYGGNHKIKCSLIYNFGKAVAREEAFPFVAMSDVPLSWLPLFDTTRCKILKICAYNF